eukprot:CAMPEP_0206322858 /NCGR_PEP_ID=MMETSP0106_2-20121207/19656_1 /ASSEMBLY_ACC=CAM_ASM_000206 /TAXON_ID=81532 /ORGANISM="Acanthoeca-like sp., Strain 10tr" /LENGTH=84 /DNA_ID=CAMNT_0053755071 /DNA_START=222 /DNA_END=476 /DNA_ORIENTATION=-
MTWITGIPIISSTNSTARPTRFDAFVTVVEYEPRLDSIALAVAMAAGAPWAMPMKIFPIKSECTSTFVEELEYFESIVLHSSLS